MSPKHTLSRDECVYSFKKTRSQHISYSFCISIAAHFVSFCTAKGSRNKDKIEKNKSKNEYCVWREIHWLRTCSFLQFVCMVPAYLLPSSKFQSHSAEKVFKQKKLSADYAYSLFCLSEESAKKGLDKDFSWNQQSFLVCKGSMPKLVIWLSWWWFLQCRHKSRGNWSKTTNSFHIRNHSS